MKRIIIFIFLLSFLKLQAQDNFTYKVADSALSFAVNSLPEKKFYFINQLHDNEANNIIERDLLLSLNKRFNVRYDVLEFAHSAAFLLNQYLDTGDSLLLKYINPKAKFYFIKSIKAFNDTVDNSRKIKFFGVDFEGRNNGEITKKALEIITGKIKLSSNQPLQILLNAVINSSLKSEKENIFLLKNYLHKNQQDCRLLLDKYYIDVLLISNAQFDFSSKRDKAMFDNFKLLYNELAKKEENPKFFTSFGVGHIDLKNKKGIAYRLLANNDGPVKDNVCLIGAEYYNCFFNKNKIIFKASDGILNYLCKNSTIYSLNNSTNNKEKTIYFLNKNELSKLNCNKQMNEFSALIIIKNFGATSYWTWE